MATSRAIRKQDQATRCVDCGAPIRANRVVILNGASFEVPLCEACAAKGVPVEEAGVELRRRAEARSRTRLLRAYAQREPTRCRMYVLFCEEEDGQPPRGTPPKIVYFEVETLLAGDCAVGVLIPRGVGDLTGTILLTAMAFQLRGHGYPDVLARDPKRADRWPVPWPPLADGEGSGAPRPAASRKRKGSGRRRKVGAGGSTLRGRQTPAASGPSARCARCGAPVGAPAAASLAARAGDPLLCEACAEQKMLESVAPGLMAEGGLQADLLRAHARHPLVGYW